jgi:hypothetical protein
MKNPALGPQLEQLRFTGKEAASFWVRAFRLEVEIEEVVKTLGAKEQAQDVGADVPIIAEYRLGPQLTCIYVINLTIDILGLNDGLGVLYFASPDYEEEAYRLRDELSDRIVAVYRSSNKLREVRVMGDKHE